MSGTQFLSILPECSGAPRSKTRISFLYYIGSFAMWRGVEYGLVHAISACTGRVRRQFENCGYRRQYSKSACAPLCRRSGLSERSTEQGHCRVLRSCQPSKSRERLFPWRPVKNFLVPHAACPRAAMCQSFRKRACLIFETRTIRANTLSVRAGARFQRAFTSDWGENEARG